MAIQFLSREQVLYLHQISLERFGGIAGVRDDTLLDSALGMPETQFAGQYLHATVAEMAAAYAFHLAKNHPFLDGNKRTAALATVAFLELNEHAIALEDDAFTDAILRTADGSMSKAEPAEFFRVAIERATPVTP